MRKRRSFPAVVSIGTVTGQLAPALASVHVKLRTTVAMYLADHFEGVYTHFSKVLEDTTTLL